MSTSGLNAYTDADILLRNTASFSISVIPRIGGVNNVHPWGQTVTGFEVNVWGLLRGSRGKSPHCKSQYVIHSIGVNRLHAPLTIHFCLQMDVRDRSILAMQKNTSCAPRWGGVKVRDWFSMFHLDFRKGRYHQTYTLRTQMNYGLIRPLIIESDHSLVELPADR